MSTPCERRRREFQRRTVSERFSLAVVVLMAMLLAAALCEVSGVTNVTGYFRARSMTRRASKVRVGWSAPRLRRHLGPPSSVERLERAEGAEKWTYEWPAADLFGDGSGGDYFEFTIRDGVVVAIDEGSYLTLWDRCSTRRGAWSI